MQTTLSTRRPAAVAARGPSTLRLAPSSAARAAPRASRAAARAASARSVSSSSSRASLRPARRAAVAARASASGAPASTPLHVAISGPPAAGKGTQCARIVSEFGLAHISAGDLLRAEVAAGTEAGKAASACMDAGELVPDEVVVDMVARRLAGEDAATRGWLLDGYPRSKSQADAIERRGIRPQLFLVLDVPDDLLVERVAGRRLDPVTGEIYHLVFRPPPAEIVDRLQQRSDDTEEAIRNRLKTHRKHVDAVLGTYADITVRIDGSRSVDDVFADVKKAIENTRGKIQEPA